MNRKSVAAVGDVTDPISWSGTPFHFWRAASSAGFATEPWQLDLSRITWQRYAWNLAAIFRRGKGGFQYSKWFLDLAEQQIPPALFSSEIITFNQHFPRSSTVEAAGGAISHYIDAPFAALAAGRGLDLRLPAGVVARACALERENYARSRRVIVMARWAGEEVVNRCGVPAQKVFTVMPGANLELPAEWKFPVSRGRPGLDRDFVLGFVGGEWQRKGLPTLLDVRDNLSSRGWRVAVKAVGRAAPELIQRKGMEFVGYINKRTETAKFLEFLAGCDVGCLFSRREAFGISTLEFLRAGVPVAGYAIEGPADSLPPDAGFRFAPSASAAEIAEKFDGYLRDESKQSDMRRNARLWSPLVTWERCLRELQELWTTGTVRSPVQPWRGLPDSLFPEANRSEPS